MPEPSSVAPWAVEAAKLPIAFAQVREDPQLDLLQVRTLPPAAKVVMIASGGETAIMLGREPLGELHLVDMNPSQLALTRLKWNLAETASADQAMQLLGHLPMDPTERGREVTDRLQQLDIDPQLLGPTDFVFEVGPDHAGRYERVFAELREVLKPQRETLGIVLTDGRHGWQRIHVARRCALQYALIAAFEKVMSLPNLVQLFGHEATQNPRQSFAAHFASQTLHAIDRFPPESNPFLWQMLAGRFPSKHLYDWLQPNSGIGTPLRVTPTLHHGRMSAVLDAMPPASINLVHLSNILDWLTPTAAEATLACACKTLKPGGVIIIRQLNSTLDIPSLASEVVWDRTLGADLVDRDRSFFYPGLFIGVRS